MQRDPEKKAARKAARKARKNPRNTNRCAFGDGIAACTASVSNSSNAPKRKKNTFGKGVKSGNNLMAGRKLAKHNKRIARQKERNKKTNPEQPHANPRFL